MCPPSLALPLATAVAEATFLPDIAMHTPNSGGAGCRRPATEPYIAAAIVEVVDVEVGLAYPCTRLEESDHNFDAFPSRSVGIRPCTAAVEEACSVKWASSSGGGERLLPSTGVD